MTASVVAPESVAADADQESLARLGRKVAKRLDGNRAVKRIVGDKADLWAVPAFFDLVECRALMAAIDRVARPSTVDGQGVAYGARTSWTGDLDAQDPLVRRLQKRIDTLLGIDSSFGERIEGQRYRQGEEFRVHCDWFPPGSATATREAAHGGQRSFTAMVYLNEVEEGGETDFPYLDIAIRPLPGMLLAWNNANAEGAPNPWTLHAGSPVRRGTKYVVTKWYRTRRWG